MTACTLAPGSIGVLSGLGMMSTVMVSCWQPCNPSELPTLVIWMTGYGHEDKHSLSNMSVQQLLIIHQHQYFPRGSIYLLEASYINNNNNNKASQWKTNISHSLGKNKIK